MPSSGVDESAQRREEFRYPLYLVRVTNLFHAPTVERGWLSFSRYRRFKVEVNALPRFRDVFLRASSFRLARSEQAHCREMAKSFLDNGFYPTLDHLCNYGMTFPICKTEVPPRDNYLYSSCLEHPTRFANLRPWSSNSTGPDRTGWQK